MSQRDRKIKIAVWGIGLGTVLLAFACIGYYTTPIPLAEDWNLVAPLTGNETNLLAWLWEQNNEHRLPFPRLIMLGLLHLSQGDFRVGMVFNVLTLALLSIAAILTAQKLRQKASYADAFFPLLFLNLGHWENLFWTWQIGFVFPTAIACGTMLLILWQPTLISLPFWVSFCLAAIILPLCGANGLIFTPFLAIWCGYCGWIHYQRQHLFSGILLWGSGAIAVILTLLYFAAYQKPSWIPPNPGIIPSIATTISFLGMGFGSIARSIWWLFGLTAVGLLILVYILVGRAILQLTGSERQRAIALLIFLGNLTLLALAMGWGRAALVPSVEMPMRYALLAAIFPFIAFFSWQLYGITAHRHTLLLLFTCTFLFLFPLNSLMGYRGWGSWYIEGMQAIQNDIQTGVTATELAAKHQEFLIHWWNEQQLAAAMQALQNSQIKPFDLLQK